VNWFTPAELVGPRLRLDALTPEDAEGFVTALGDAGSARAVTQHLSYAPPASVAQARVLIERAVADPGRVAYAQRLRATGELLGTTSFYDIDPTNRAIAIGHTWLAQPYWRTGLNSESKLLMLRHAFDRLGAERVVWHTDIRNTRSQAAIERLGAVKEGVLRHHRIRRDGSWRDTVTYAMLGEEWPAAKRRLVDAVPLTLRRIDVENRYVARFGDEHVAEIDYVPQGSVLYVKHTGTAPAWRHCGIAARITRHALDDMRSRGLGIRAGCSYTRSFLADHPGYADLVA
jgi:RimJ/RimL family protein N-acetyltransferase/predicted GNAT family acetyltransferase